MTREAKIGLLMVAVLVGVFGFLLYKRVTRPADAPDEVVQQLADGGADGGGGKSADSTFEDDPPVMPKHHKSNLTREIEHVAHEAEEVVKDLAQEFTTTQTATRDQRDDLALPTETESSIDDDHRAQLLRARAERGRGEPIETVSNEQPEELSSDLARLPESDEREADTKDDPFVAAAAKAEETDLEFAKPIERARSEPLESEDSDNQTEFNDRKVERFKARRGQIEEDPAESPQLPDRTGESQIGQRRRVVESMPEESLPASTESVTADLADGDSYTVQPNDSFWSISKKRYGTARYFSALAAHNQEIIPDPKRMRAGAVISTPDAAVLERQYQSVISKTVTDDAGDIESVPTSQASDISGRAGYFVDAEGNPMYRVGPKDNLAEIARVHLRRKSRWVQIREMNRNVLRDGNELKTGTVLRLPADATGIRFERAGDNFR